MRNKKSIMANGSNSAVIGNVRRSPKYGHRTGLKKKARSKIIFAKKSLSLFSIGLLILFALFFVVMAQNLYLTKIDTHIGSLQTEYNELKALNDSKEGNLIASRNYDTIVPAAKSYGMTEITGDQKIVMTVKDKNRE